MLYRSFQNEVWDGGNQCTVEESNMDSCATITFTQHSWQQMGISHQSQSGWHNRKTWSSVVANEFHQQGIGYEEMFSPVFKLATIRTALSIRVFWGWAFRQLVVKNVFVHEFLKEDVYMAQPPLGCQSFYSQLCLQASLRHFTSSNRLPGKLGFVVWHQRFMPFELFVILTSKI